MTPRKIQLGDTEVIQQILTRLTNLNNRVGVLELTPAPIIPVPPVSVVSVTINSASHLIIGFSDGSSSDAGFVGGTTTPGVDPAIYSGAAAVALAM